jgi:DNA-binding response OmpR family regulator
VSIRQKSKQTVHLNFPHHHQKGLKTRRVFYTAGEIIKAIMIVDEEPDILEQVKSYLATEDVEIITATNSRQALEQLKGENEETFDLILINTTMPGSKKTALFSLKPAVKKQPSGIDQFLQKPFTKQQLVEFVKEQIR